MDPVDDDDNFSVKEGEMEDEADEADEIQEKAGDSESDIPVVDIFRAPRGKGKGMRPAEAPPKGQISSKHPRGTIADVQWSQIFNLVPYFFFSIK